MTPAGIAPATFQFVAQNLNHCATAVRCLQLGHPNIPFPSVLLSEFSLSFSSLSYISLITLFSTAHFLLRSRNQFSHSYFHASCMSVIRHIYCINPFQYYSLCPSFRAQSFRNWFSSFCRECVLRPAVPNSQKEQSSVFQPVT